jgi:hypothetical protein
VIATDGWFSSFPPVSSTNKTDRHDITAILLKVTLNTIKQASKQLLVGCTTTNTANSIGLFGIHSEVVEI